MAAIPVLAHVSGDATALVINVTGGVFSLTTTRAYWDDAVRVTATCSGAGVALSCTASTASVVTSIQFFADMVPVLGFANGKPTEISIDATTGVVTAGSDTTTLTALFGGASTSGTPFGLLLSITKAA